MTTSAASILAYRKELKNSIDDREKLSRLHSIVTERINGSYGEEKEMLVKFRQEVKNALNCHLLTPW